MAKAERNAQERIKQAFLQELSMGEVTEEEAALYLRVGETLDAHFRQFCSFYEPDMLLQAMEKGHTLLGCSMGRSLLRRKDYNRISVTRLSAAAGVNRATFYKYYPNVASLYEECCRDLSDRFLSVPVPTEKTPENMYDYGLQLWRVLGDNLEQMFILSYRVGHMAMPYRIANLLHDQLAASLTTQERTRFIVQENLAVFRELFSSFFSTMTVDILLPEVYTDRNLPPYEPNRSLVENVAGIYTLRYGGSLDVYYAFGIAALKLLSQKDFSQISVSELCRTAGYARNTFYTHFQDAQDYEFRVLENLTLGCVTAFLFFLDHPDQLTPEALKTFRGEMVGYKVEGVRSIFVNGGISLIFSMTFSYLLRILLHRAGEDPFSKDGSLRAKISYYVAYAMRLFSMYYIGDMTDAELAAKSKQLARIKQRIGLG